MTALRELAELRELVSIIADWKLPETGETWPSGGPVGYATMFGSLGVRDYMRNIATKALAILDAEGDGGAGFGEADGVALRSVKVGETLTESQWSGICQFVRHQDSIIRGLREALRNPVPDIDAYPARPGVVRDEDVRDLVSKAMRRAWSLGQTYWQQADSDSWKQQDKSSDTQRKFDALIEETLAAIQGERHDH